MAESASGVLLLISALLALAWANSPWAALYQAVFTPLSGFINDGLMTLFFLTVGMEIKRELLTGELRTPSRALLPAVAALGGMVAPAAIFLFFNAGGAGARGWAVPIATDIAFCLGTLSLLGDRIPRALRVYILALAVFDDVGGILVIALFYGHALQLSWLLGSAGVLAGLLACNRRRVQSLVVYGLGGLALWVTLQRGGIHATMAGVLLGLIIPARPGDLPMLSLSPLERLLHTLQPWVRFAVMPLFALSSAGVRLEGMGANLWRGPVLLGAALGLFIGKQLGIFVSTQAAIRLGLSSTPGGAPSGQLYGVAVTAGIGFTVSLFIADLAFNGSAALLAQAKLGVLLGSFASGTAGYLMLRLFRASSR